MTKEEILRRYYGLKKIPSDEVSKKVKEMSKLNGKSLRKNELWTKTSDR